MLPKIHHHLLERRLRKQGVDMTLRQALAKGFDKTIFFPETEDSDPRIRIGCSQCSAAIIQGVACHETGCPNQNHECKGCESIVPRGIRYCEDCQ